MPFVVPSLLVQQYGPVSGRIPFDHLVTGGTEGWRFWLPAARCHRAMMAAARLAGFDPRSTGTYRTYERQVSLFKERYSHVNSAVGRKFWPVSLGGDDRYWWKIQNPVTKKYPADAAVPGTSEHGWGCADDVAEERDGDVPAESISAAFHQWLTINARDYGFEQTNRSEDWHWAYTLGGVIPPLVLIYEQPPPPPLPPPGEDEMRILVLTDAGGAAILLTGFTGRWLDPARYNAFHYFNPAIKDEPASKAWLANVTMLGALPLGVEPSHVWGHQPDA